LYDCATSFSQLEASVRRLEHERLSRGDSDAIYVLGGHFTLADIALYPWFEQHATLERFSTFRMPAEFDRIRTWMAAVAARPAVKRCAQTDDRHAQNYRRYRRRDGKGRQHDSSHVVCLA
jgi:glutathione S-transferase